MNNNKIINELNKLDEILIQDVELRKANKLQNDSMMKQTNVKDIEELKIELEKEKMKQRVRFNFTDIEKNKLEEWTGR